MFYVKLFQNSSKLNVVVSKVPTELHRVKIILSYSAEIDRHLFCLHYILFSLYNTVASYSFRCLCESIPTKCGHKFAIIYL
jgi:hypothetical protein